jgi:hypothetical protein
VHRLISAWNATANPRPAEKKRKGNKNDTM